MEDEERTWRPLAVAFLGSRLGKAMIPIFIFFIGLAAVTGCFFTASMTLLIGYAGVLQGSKTAWLTDDEMRRAKAWRVFWYSGALLAFLIGIIACIVYRI